MCENACVCVSMTLGYIGDRLSDISHSYIVLMMKVKCIMPGKPRKWT